MLSYRGVTLLLWILRIMWPMYIKYTVPDLWNLLSERLTRHTEISWWQLTKYQQLTMALLELPLWVRTIYTPLQLKHNAWPPPKISFQLPPPQGLWGYAYWFRHSWQNTRRCMHLDVLRENTFCTLSSHMVSHLKCPYVLLACRLQ